MRESTNEQAAGLVPVGAPFRPTYEGPQVARRFPTTEASTTVVFPGSSKRIIAQAAAPLTEEHMMLLRNGTHQLKAFGRATYTDVFGAEHVSTFCTYLLPDMSQMAWCPTYNDAN